MTIQSDKFEKKIHRIHELIEQDGSIVTWNDRIEDPDNADQTRQIDISIRRDGKLTLVECRIRKHSQDVKWIEELIGKRLSLRADAVIAVSNSGFTEGAILKAKQFGIILRDLQTVTEQEVKSWGFSTRVSLTFFEYKNVDLSLGLVIDKGVPSIDEVAADLKQKHLYRLFEMASDAIAEQTLPVVPVRYKGHFGILDDLYVCGAKIAEVIFKAEVTKIIQDLKIPSIVAYDAPDVRANQRNVLIEEVDLGDFEITQSSDKVFVAADLSPIQCPPNCQFKYISFDFGRIVSMEAFELLKPPPFSIPLERIKIGFWDANGSAGK